MSPGNAPWGAVTAGDWGDGGSEQSERSGKTAPWGANAVRHWGDKKPNGLRLEGSRPFRKHYMIMEKHLKCCTLLAMLLIFYKVFLSYGVGFGDAAKDFVPLPQNRKDNIYRGGCVKMSLLSFF